MKKVFLFAAVVTLFAACSSDEDLAQKDQPQVQTAPGAIAFDVYTQKATTRAGWTGSLTTTDLKENSSDPNKPYEHSNGFGVFGFYTDNNEYEQRSVPNFMYNQQVTWKDASPDPGYWEYEPIMYWPNEYGSNAESDDYDKVTFFAYAPYVEVVPTSGKLDKKGDWTDSDVKDAEGWGITGMTRNSNQGDPIIKYIASFDNSKSVDLCWGVQPELQWNTTQGGTNDKLLVAGLPWLNVQRPAEAATQAAANQRVKFVFKHATAQMTVKIDADVNEVDRSHAANRADKTRIWVRQVTFNGFALKGALNLNNETANTPKWLDYGGQNELVAETVTIYDQRKDGKEGVSGAIATNEKLGGLNPILIQDEAYKNGDDVYNSTALTNRAGVTNDAVNLFNTTGGDFFHVIPIEGEEFEVEIVYDVETVDPNLAQNLSDGQTKGSSIENRISKKISFGDETSLKPGHSYILNLHLGMNSVEFDAAVTEWQENVAQPVDLPLNVPQYAAPGIYGDNDPAGDMIYLPYTLETNAYTLAISGMDAGESLTAAQLTAKYDDGSTRVKTTAIDGFVGNNVNAQMNGYAIVTVATPVNNTTANRQQEIKWTGTQSGKYATFTFTQKAHPLEMKVGSDNTYDLKAKTDSEKKQLPLTTTIGTITYGWMCQGLTGNFVAVTPSTASGNDHGIPSGSSSYIKVWRNGTRLTWASDLAASAFTFTDAAGTISFNDPLQAGDIITVTLKTGDAPEETISVKIVDTTDAP